MELSDIDLDPLSRMLAQESQIQVQTLLLVLQLLLSVSMCVGTTLLWVLYFDSCCMIDLLCRLMGTFRCEIGLCTSM